jgi:hypothetical protein
MRGGKVWNIAEHPYKRILGMPIYFLHMSFGILLFRDSR